MPRGMWMLIIAPSAGLVPLALIPALQGSRPPVASTLLAVFCPLCLGAISYGARTSTSRLGQSLYPPLAIAAGMLFYGTLGAWVVGGTMPWDMLAFMTLWAIATVAVAFIRNWRRWPSSNNQ